jgi:hypothetical protein
LLLGLRERERRQPGELGGNLNRPRQLHARLHHLVDEAARHDAAIGAASEHATASDGVTVDGRHHWLWVEEHRIIEPMQHRQKLANVT